MQLVGRVAGLDERLQGDEQAFAQQVRPRHLFAKDMRFLRGARQKPRRGRAAHKGVAGDGLHRLVVGGQAGDAEQVGERRRSDPALAPGATEAFREARRHDPGQRVQRHRAGLVLPVRLQRHGGDRGCVAADQIGEATCFVQQVVLHRGHPSTRSASTVAGSGSAGMGSGRGMATVVRARPLSSDSVMLRARATLMSMAAA